MEATLRATRTQWVLDTKPTAAEPCLIASRAYSTWKMRPWGELWAGGQRAASGGVEPGDVQGDGVVVVVVSEHPEGSGDGVTDGGCW